MLIDAPYLLLAILAALALAAVLGWIVLDRWHSLTRQLTDLLSAPSPSPAPAAGVHAG